MYIESKKGVIKMAKTCRHCKYFNKEKSYCWHGLHKTSAASNCIVWERGQKK